MNYAMYEYLVSMLYIAFMWVAVAYMKILHKSSYGHKSAWDILIAGISLTTEVPAQHFEVIILTFAFLTMNHNSQM